MFKLLIAIVGAVILLTVVSLGSAWLSEGNDFFLYKYFAPKTESVRREVFEQSKAYNQGMIQELQNMQMAYIAADHDGKTAMASVILHRAADYDGKMPEDLRDFINDLKQQRGLKSSPATHKDWNK